MNNVVKDFISNKAAWLRINSIRATTASNSGHPTTCLSAADLVATLFFHVMKYDPKNPKNINNDRFILSKGHAAPVLYAAWKEVGVLTEEQLISFRKFDSILEGHPTPRFIYNEAATGSLGQGLSIGVGMALNARLDNLDYKTYVLMGDGEIAEGSIWEAAELADKYNLNNLIGIVDCNRLGQSGESINNHDVDKYAKKFAAFGWNTFIVDGHNVEELIKTFDKIENLNNKPTVIIAKTFKGYGLDNVADKNGFHGKPFNEVDALAAIEELKRKFLKSEVNEVFVPKLPTEVKNTEILSNSCFCNVCNFHICEQSKAICHVCESNGAVASSLFSLGNKMATREAFGYALRDLGDADSKVVVLDADVKNSTYTDIFEKKHKDRFFQCFIAEQNMVSIATGFEARGKIPFAATFGAFFSRAFDQIRMAGIGRNALRLSGSHCGVSIGEDGPSQMALEDIAMFRSVPNSIVFYPSDPVSTYKIVQLMAGYNNGISYIRTTRGKTPVIYDKFEEFKIGGCKIVKQSSNDKVCIIGAGVTLFEALSAYELLKKEGINISVIDLYSVKPLDIKTIVETVQKSGGKMITVEDHYLAGGIGEAVVTELSGNDFEIKNLYVKGLSRSGTPEALLAYAEIDCNAIVKAVKAIV